MGRGGVGVGVTVIGCEVGVLGSFRKLPSRNTGAPISPISVAHAIIDTN